MRILYTSDIHANPEHLDAMLRAAEKEAVSAIIIGGDLVPHHLPAADTVGILRAQALYLENVFVPAVKEFKQGRETAIYLDLANDDFICNRRKLSDHTPELLKLLHEQKHQLTDVVDIIGYMIVPPTPFYRKDWEKPDASKFPHPQNNMVSLDGYSSVGGRLNRMVIDLESDDTIENDLARLSEKIDRPFILVSHSPPYKTPLDILDNGVHVGSVSIRRFIEDWSRQGLLVAGLHGHIHGAPQRSGAVYTTIAGSVCINPGQNEGLGSALRYVVFELDDRLAKPAINIIHEP